MDRSRSLPPITVAALGHFRHGKTTLAAALTQVLAREGYPTRPIEITELDRARPAPPISPATIHTQALPMIGELACVTHLDTPGRADLGRHASRAAACADALLLVVAADDGVRDQTREHVILAAGAGSGGAAKPILVFLNRCEIASPDLLDLVESETRDLLARYGFDANEAPFIRGAALPALEGEPLWHQTVLDLALAIERSVSPRTSSENAKLVFRSHRVHKNLFRDKPTDCVLEGFVLQGRLFQGQKLLMVPARGPNAEVRVVELMKEGELVQDGKLGEWLGVRIRAGTKAAIRRGQIGSGTCLLDPEAIALHAQFTAEITFIATDEGGRHCLAHTPLGVHVTIGSLGAPGIVRWEGAPLEPGSTVEHATINLSRPLPMQLGDRLILRDGSSGCHLRRIHGPRWNGTTALGTVREFPRAVP